MTADLHRATPLLEGPAVGHLVVSRFALRRTQELLAAAGRYQPPHEGLVWWAGRQIGHDFLVVACVRPTVDSGPQHVYADESAVGAAATATRRCRLGIVGQAHSHPGSDTRHSDGDDHLVLMPFEGMFSLVVGHYGADSVLPSGGATLHQFQQRRWTKITNPSDAVILVDDVIEP
jgi:hypothetical protein